MPDPADIRPITATLAAAIIAKRDGVSPKDAVDIYLEVLAVMKEKAPNGKPKQPPLEISPKTLAESKKPSR